MARAAWAPGCPVASEAEECSSSSATSGMCPSLSLDSTTSDVLHPWETAQETHATRSTRVRRSATQVAGLKRAFQQNQYLTNGETRELAKNLGLELKQVTIWFQNQRARSKGGAGVSPNVPSSKNTRARLSFEKVAKLECAYNMERAQRKHYLPHSEMLDLAKELSLAPRQVTNWFQNRRNRDARSGTAPPRRTLGASVSAERRAEENPCPSMAEVREICDQDESTLADSPERGRSPPDPVTLDPGWKQSGSMATGSVLDWHDAVELLLDNKEGGSSVSIDVSFDAAMVGLSLASEHLGGHLDTSDVSIGHKIAHLTATSDFSIGSEIGDGSGQEIGCGEAGDMTLAEVWALGEVDRSLEDVLMS